MAGSVNTKLLCSWLLTILVCAFALFFAASFCHPRFCSPHDASAAISPSGEAGSLGHSCISSIATIASTISSSDCPALMGYLPLIDRRAIMIVSSILEESR
jgi:hypothetical protein